MEKTIIFECGFYLDAWLYCVQHNLPKENIQRQGFRSWIVLAA